MCCFTGAVREVAHTQVFARLAARRQVVAYAMEFSAAEDLAMVLPLPVAPGTKESDVRFLSLGDQPGFFEDLATLFPSPVSAQAGDLATLSLDEDVARLEVHEVGAFEASFVPTMADFARLDPRFRIDPTVWADVPDPELASSGFAVFKLRAGERQTVHPMAFEFPTRNPAALFFPTLHVHDGRYHREADFSHLLYGRLPDVHERATAEHDDLEVVPPPQLATVHGPLWIERATGEPSGVPGLADCSEVLGNEGVLFRSAIHGRRVNRDVWMDRREVAALLAP